MSCFIMSNESLSILANSLEHILNSGFNRFGFEAPESLAIELSDCCDKYGFYSAGLIYRRLYALNLSAYNGRYKKRYPLDEIPEMTTKNIITDRKYNKHEIIQPWHYQLCKLVECFIYQTCEDATRADELHTALTQFSHILSAFIVHNSNEYHAFQWG